MFYLLSFRHELLDGLVLFEQKGPHDALLDAVVAGAAAVAAAHGALALLGARVRRGLHAPEAGERRLAVAADRAARALGRALAHELPARRPHPPQPARAGVVGVAAALPGPARVRHDRGFIGRYLKHGT